MTEIPEHIKTYKKLKKKAKKIVDTTGREHGRAYDAATSLIEDEEGNIDYEKLDEPEIQEKFAEKMTDYYISKAEQALGVKKDKKDKLHNTLLMKAYAGVTEHELNTYIDKEGKNFTLNTFHEKYRPSFEKRISDDLYAATKSHLKEEHIPDLVKHTKSGDFIDANKLTLEEAIGLLDMYEEVGAISPKMVKGKRFAKKEYYKKYDKVD